jgi:16S rRNA processing protein RimM
MTGAETEQEWTWLARIRRPQGRKGEVFADILTDFPEKFEDRHQLWLIPAPEVKREKSNTSKISSIAREATLVGHWLHKGGVVLHFEGIGSISSAETLGGLIVAIPQSQRAALEEDEFYVGDLIGCTLVDVAGAAPVEVGVIEEVDRSAGPVALLVIQRGNSEVLVPFAKSYLRVVNIAAKRVEMALPEGLVDLNA